MTSMPPHHIRLYILCGLPFAGKSTLAAALARRFGWSIIAIDAINHERGLGSNAAPITAEQWDETYAEAYRRLGAALTAGATVVFDTVSFTRAQRDDLRAIAAMRAAAARVIYLDTPEAVCRERWQANRKTGARFDVREEDFERVASDFELPTVDERPIVCDATEAVNDWVERTLGEFTSRG